MTNLDIKDLKVVNNSLNNFDLDEDYHKLVATLRNELIQGLENAQKSVEARRVRTYWMIGKHIGVNKLKKNFRAIRNERLYERLSQDIGTSKDLLVRCVHFYKTYKKLPKHDSFTWTHYVYLTKISDEFKRKEMEQRILDEGITSTQIKYRVVEMNALDKEGNIFERKLEEQRGILYAYKIRTITDVHKGNRLVEVDCGFNINIDIPKSQKFKIESGEIFLSEKNDGKYNLRRLRDKPYKLYTYKAIIERVIDADTLLVCIDVGFNINIRQRLRFRGINAPEITTAQGKIAKEFVLKRLKGLDFVVVKTYGFGKYGRPLTDIFYRQGESDPQAVADEGTFLNQELVDHGLAELVVDS